MLLAVLLSLLCTGVAAAQTHNTDPFSSLGPGFESRRVNTNGTTLHYVRGGSGPAIILLHGFPEDWSEFRNVMPRLAKRFTVVAVDLRGVGDSSPETAGYDAANMARDIHELVSQVKLNDVYLVGHDIGGMVAYAYVRQFSSDLRGAMILDVAFPGLDPWDELVGHAPWWHVRFHQTRLPEQLLPGRQAAYFRYFLSSASEFSDADVAHYAHAYRDPDHLRAAVEPYRAFPENAKFFAAQTPSVSLPIVLGAGKHDAFAEFVPRIAAAMRSHGCTNMKTELVDGAAHYVFEEKPDALAELIEGHAGGKQ